MEKTILVIVLATLAGMVAAVANSGLLGADAGALARAPALLFGRTRTPFRQPVNASDASGPGAQGAFSYCLQRPSGDPERTLRDLLEFHEHSATLDFVECLVDVEPQRFCPPEGGRRAAEAMEIYLWSRDDARLATPEHALTEKIHLLDRAAAEGEPADGVDPFALNWSSPRDAALFARLKKLARQGYLAPNAFADSSRAELREVLRDVKPQGAPCVGVARAE